MTNTFSLVEMNARDEADLPNQSKKLLVLELFRRLEESHIFAKGQVVKWKPGLKNRNVPEYGQPAVVTCVLSKVIYEETAGSGTPYFMEPLTIIIGFHHEDDLVEFYVDGRRFEPYE